jgi:hypothetical protein
MHLTICLCIAFLFPGISITSDIKPPEIVGNDQTNKVSVTVLSHKKHLTGSKATCDTLIPIFGGLFITCAKIDSSHYQVLAQKRGKDTVRTFYEGDWISGNSKKWGVVDSAGNIIVPFICDGVKQIAADTGIISVYTTSYSLNTGIPRYMYAGDYYYFTKTGILQETKKAFIIKVQYLADWHHPKFVTIKGPAFYLPDAHRDATWKR